MVTFPLSGHVDLDALVTLLKKEKTKTSKVTARRVVSPALCGCWDEVPAAVVQCAVPQAGTALGLTPAFGRGMVGMAVLCLVPVLSVWAFFPGTEQGLALVLSSLHSSHFWLLAQTS